jgi:ADP-ribosylglycohydrolase
VNDDIEEIILGGLAQIPSTSRLYEAVTGIIIAYKEGVSGKDCFNSIHKIYDEHNTHDWCHTISNALIVVAALLYGNGNYGKSICTAVQAGFDTDCNGATVGSVLGMKNGVESIGLEWTKPINGELDTTIFGIGKVNISDLVASTMKHVK